MSAISYVAISVSVYKNNWDCGVLGTASLFLSKERSLFCDLQIYLRYFLYLLASLR